MLQPGDHIDRFTVEALLGEGGLAKVYLVRHRTLGSRLALKVLMVRGSAIGRRLLREGRIQATLSHPHVVAVHDVIEHEGYTALVMEYVEGPTLAAMLAQTGALPEPDALALFGQMLAGVTAAHDHGVLHRDLKPANVLIATTSMGSVAKITDFGIARTGDGAPGDTMQGDLIGTPGYMAPEQVVDPTTVDVRADIYALGAMLYCMVTGRPPFLPTARWTDTVDAAQRGDFPPVASLAPGLSPAVAQTIDRCLHPDPEARPPTGRALADAIWGPGAAEALGMGSSAAPSPTPGPSRRSLPTLVPPSGAGPADAYTAKPAPHQGSEAEPPAAAAADSAAAQNAEAPPELKATPAAESGLGAPAHPIAASPPRSAAPPHGPDEDTPPTAAPRRDAAHARSLTIAALAVAGIATGAWLWSRRDPPSTPPPADTQAVTTAPPPAPTSGSAPAEDVPAQEPPAGPDTPQPTAAAPPTPSTGGGAASSDAAPPSTPGAAGRPGSAPTAPVQPAPSAATPAPTALPPSAPAPASAAASPTEPPSPAQPSAAATSAPSPAAATPAPAPPAPVTPAAVSGTFAGKWQGRPVTIVLSPRAAGRVAATVELNLGSSVRVLSFSGALEPDGSLLLHAPDDGWTLRATFADGVLSGMISQPDSRKPAPFSARRQ